MVQDPSETSSDAESGSASSSRTIWQKLATFYKHTALIWLNVCLLLLLVNVTVQPLIDSPSLTPNPVVARHGEQIYTAYPDLTRPQVDSLINEAYLYPGFRYEPYSQFKERPRHGRYVKVSQHGFRMTPHQGPWPLDTTYFNIFVFGGSTTFGYGVADAETIPARIQGHMNRRSQGKSTRVYNFGRGYHFSAQERVVFETLVHEGHRPDLAIFIDGANDISIWKTFQGKPYFTRHLSGFFHQMSESGYWSLDMPFLVYLRQRNQRQTEQQLDDQAMNVSAPQQPGSAPRVMLANHTLQQPSVSHPAQAPVAWQEMIEESQTSEWQEVLDRYFRNQRMIRATADTFGIETLFVWQPVPFYRYDTAKYHVLKEDAPSPPWSEAHRRMEHLALTSPDPRFLILSSLQEHEKQNLYVDMVHYNKYFCNVIALRIVHYYLTELAPERLAPEFRKATRGE